MVKRAIAAFIGAIVGALFWLGFHAVLSALPHADPSTHACENGPLVDCVRYEAPVEPPPLKEAREGILAPCKGWLEADRGSIAQLSECLHAARAHDRRPQLVGGSI